jgi:hypothetical protein
MHNYVGPRGPKSLSTFGMENLTKVELILEYHSGLDCSALGLNPRKAITEKKLFNGTAAGSEFGLGGSRFFLFLGF